jgi:heme/copper-type cytochrome/quinol oxidase subunit 2
MLTKEYRIKNIEQRESKIKLLLFFLFSFFFSLSSKAQCAMCRAALESEEGGVKAEAVNDGIVYLMAIPYVLVGVIGYFIYKMRYGKKKNTVNSNF